MTCYRPPTEKSFSWVLLSSLRDPLIKIDIGSLVFFPPFPLGPNSDKIPTLIPIISHRNPWACLLLSSTFASTLALACLPFFCRFGCSPPPHYINFHQTGTVRVIPKQYLVSPTGSYGFYLSLCRYLQVTILVLCPPSPPQPKSIADGLDLLPISPPPRYIWLRPGFTSWIPRNLNPPSLSKVSSPLPFFLIFKACHLILPFVL